MSRRVLATIVVIGVGGFVGANARYWLALWLSGQIGRADFPYATLIINVTGSFGLALLAALISRGAATETARLLVGVGFFGAYTTFSTFSVEALALARAGAWVSAALYIAATNALCLTGAALGYTLGSR